MELNLERRELQLEEKKLILEIAIRVNDLRSDLAFLKNKPLQGMAPTECPLSA